MSETAPRESSGYNDIGDYAVIGDGNTLALVSAWGSIDWLCPVRFDTGSCFGRLLDSERGGFCEIAAARPSDVRPAREYEDSSLVLRTKLEGEDGAATLIDCMTLTGDTDDPQSRREVLRVLEGARGNFEYSLKVAPRFDYGGVDPWIRRLRKDLFVALGGNDAIVISSDADLDFSDDRHALVAEGILRPRERVRLSLVACDPSTVDEVVGEGGFEPEQMDDRIAETAAWWRRWGQRLSVPGGDYPGLERSAAVLRALTYTPSGAIVAAGTTSLPEVMGGKRNWDYRLSWIRDSVLAIRSLAEVGCEDDAAAFRLFLERSAGGNAKDLQVVFGIGGERRLNTEELAGLEGYRGSAPVRVGNQASGQLQLDVYGYLLEQSWRWYERGHEPDDDYWRFLVELVDAAIENWQEPDAGIWEWPSGRKHFVHSKVMCWAAVDRGLRLAEACMRKAPERRWRSARKEMRETIEEKGYEKRRGVFVQAFGSGDLDAAVLRLPSVGFCEYEDERMVRTANAIAEELGENGLIRRYEADDGLPGKEGAFVATTFWLAEALAGQGRLQKAREFFDAATATANDVGLFSEEFDAKKRVALGNFPQALSHLAHLEAAVALNEALSGSELTVDG